MKKTWILAALVMAVTNLTSLAETVTQTFYIDFGDVNAGRGRTTDGADANGHYWTNVKSQGNNYLMPGAVFQMVNSVNETTGYDILVNTRFMSNGQGAGGYMNPDADLLGDLAIETATEDYLFVEDFQDYNFVTFRNLDQTKAYRFHAFGSRANNQTRIGRYSFRGLNSWSENHQMAGEGCGEGGYNGNNSHISVSEPIFPDENGCITFTISRVQNMMHINAMKVEEIEAERPDLGLTFSQAMYIDFGENGVAPNNRWHKSEGADANGHYWNNFFGTTGSNGWVDVIPKGTAVSLVNADNADTGITATLMDYLKTNGGDNGGLKEPTVENLRDLAVASATGDYVYVELSQPSVSVEFTGVDPQKAYRIHAFGSRATSETDDRNGFFRLEGSTSWRDYQWFSGRGIGGSGVHGNVRNVAVSDYIYPTSDGRLVFTIERNKGMAHLNLLKLEEFTPEQAPEQRPEIVSVSVTGDAVEGSTVAMSPVMPTGINTGLYSAYLKLGVGNYSFSATCADESVVTLGASDSEGTFDFGGDDFVSDTESVVRILLNANTQTVEVLPITSFDICGSIAPEGTVLEYAGNGCWESTVALDKSVNGEYLTHYIYFTLNNSDAMAIRRIAGSNRVGMVSDGYNGENIRLNNGEYTIRVDLNGGIYTLNAPVNEHRVSVFGSSVANGQGAGDWKGYAYLYGQQLQQRTADGLSEYPLHTSGISIGGNTTTNLLDRYDDMLNDFGRYVMIGLSLGNEGIHGAADREKVFNGFRDNMLTLIERMRADGKVPVVVNNYTRGDYDADDYASVKSMNMLIHEWDVPSVNVLGAIDDGAGHWAAGYIADVAHPNQEGHRQFMQAIVPSLFDALAQGKPLPERVSSGSVTLDSGKYLSFTPEGRAQAFTLDVLASANEDATIYTFLHGAKGQYQGSLAVKADGSVIYNSPLKDPLTSESKPMADGKMHHLTLTHYFARGITFLYIDGVLAGSVNERLTLGEVVLGNSTTPINLGEIWFWRSGMNAEEIAAHVSGKLMKSSLEIYSPADADAAETLANHAQSLNFVKINNSTASGIDERGSDSFFRVTPAEGVVLIETAAPAEVVIYTMDGRVVRRLTVDNCAAVPLAQGLYLVNNHKVVIH